MPLQPYGHNAITDIDELNISAVHAKALPDLSQGRLHLVI